MIWLLMLFIPLAIGVVMVSYGWGHHDWLMVGGGAFSVLFTLLMMALVYRAVRT